MTKLIDPLRELCQERKATTRRYRRQLSEREWERRMQLRLPRRLGSQAARPRQHDRNTADCVLHARTLKGIAGVDGDSGVVHLSV